MSANPLEFRRRDALRLALGATLPAGPAWALPPQALRIPDPATFSAHPQFFTDALMLALNKTAGPGESLELKPAAPSIPRERLRQWLQDGRLDVLWSSSSPEREARLLPVRFNLLKGVNELRYLLVRASELKRFEAVRTLEDLKAFQAGAGTYWSDAEILRANGFAVQTTPNNEPLFKMLIAGRFDFIPRAPDEIEGEVRGFADAGLVAVPGLALHYTQPVYFFTSRQQPQLAQRLLQGLEAAAADGSFDALFMSVPALRSAWLKARAFNGLRFQLRDLPPPSP